MFVFSGCVVVGCVSVPLLLVFPPVVPLLLVVLLFSVVVVFVAPFVPLNTILCIASYVSLDSIFVSTIFPFSIFVIYVSVFFPFAPFCFTFSVPAGNVASSMYFVDVGIVDTVTVLNENVYSSLSFIPYNDTVATPFLADAIIFTGYFLVFLNLKSVIPYTTVASIPASTYDVTNWWFLLSTISKFALSTALYRVVEIWHIPPPIPSTTCPASYTLAFLYPAAAVLAPRVLLYENVSFGITTFPFILLHASCKFVVLSLSPPS